MSKLSDPIANFAEEEDTQTSPSGLLSQPAEEEAASQETPGAVQRGVAGLERKLGRVQSIKDAQKKPSLLTPEETGTPEEEASVIRMMEAAGAPVEDLKAAHSLLRPDPSPGSLSADREALMDPAFKLLEAPKLRNETGITDIVNFLVGDEMAIVGAKLDNNGLAWDWEIARKQWAEEPVWVNLLATASLVGTIAFPAMKAVQTSVKFGRAGSMLGKFGPRAEEIMKWKKLGAIDAATPEAEVSDTFLRMVRTNDYARSKHLDFEAKKIAEMEGNLEVGMPLPSGAIMGHVDKLKWQFDKRFTNSYFEQIDSISKNGAVKKEFVDNLDKLWKNEKLGRFFVDIPEDARGTAIYANLMMKSSKAIDLDAVIMRANPGMAAHELVSAKNALKLTPAEQTWADGMYDAMKTHQDEALREGFVTQEMRDRIGEIHLPAFGTKTPVDLASTRSIAIPITGGAVKRVAGEPAQRVFKAFNFPRLDAPQIRHRASEIGDVADRLFKGELLTAPEKLTFGGYVTDRLLLNNFKFIRDHAMKFGKSEADVVTAFGSAAKAEEKGWVSLSKLRNGVPEVESTMRRMLKTAGHTIGDGEQLPFIHKAHYEAMFGQGGLFEQTQNVGSLVQLLTVIHKTAKTVFNIPTHLNNLFGNFAFLGMAGYNPMAPRNLETMHGVTGAFIKWANAHDGLVAAGKKAETLFDPVTRRLKGVDLGRIKVRGKTFDLNDEFLDPMVKDVIGEESAFLHAEGLAVVQSFLDRAKKGSAAAAVAEGMLKMKNMNKFTQKTFDYMTKAYLGEDVVPKLAYYLDLRAQGMSKEWAVLEVGRRLPVYSTVGSSIQAGRKVYFPWATFPAEATRIMKNNINDHPLAVLPWLHAPGIIQAGFAATGLGPSTYDEAKEQARALPTWAQTATTVTTNAQGSEMGARAGMAAAGGAVGTALGGVGGGLLGAAAGAALPVPASVGAGVGAGVGAIAGGSPGALLGGIVGGAVGFMGDALKEDRESGDQVRGAIMRWLPWSAMTPASNSPEYVWDLPGTMAQLPVEPLAILRPAIEIMGGRTAFGQEIPNEGTGDLLGKMFAGTIGMFMPPFMQKYGFKVTTPDQPITQMLVGGQGIPGDVTNASRFLSDTGMAVDTQTGEPGNMNFDFLMNNTNGLWQSYAVRPETRLMNEGRQEEALSKVRGYYGKQISYFAQNNDWDTVTQLTEKAFSTFTRQYAADPGVAQAKFSEWMGRYLKSFGNHPGLRGMSAEELQARFNLASKHATEMRSGSRRDIMSAIDKERRIRAANEKKTKHLYK